MNRDLHWAACRNVRDLGGLGGIRRGALVRADSLQQLTADGWAALHEHGVRTVIDLRNPDEIGDDAAPRPPGLTTERFPLDGLEHQDFWQHWFGRPEFGTALYYGPWLERFPDRARHVLGLIARARPGGVAIHCVGGRDRTGLVTMLVLMLAGVPRELIVEDYALTDERIPLQPEVRAFHDALGTTPAEAFAAVLAGVDARRYIGEDDLAALHERGVASSAPPG
jgi:protein-tyrosine phosphatase